MIRRTDIFEGLCVSFFPCVVLGSVRNTLTRTSGSSPCPFLSRTLGSSCYEHGQNSFGVEEIQEGKPVCCFVSPNSPMLAQFVLTSSSSPNFSEGGPRRGYRVFTQELDAMLDRLKPSVHEMTLQSEVWFGQSLRQCT